MKTYFDNSILMSLFISCLSLSADREPIEPGELLSSPQGEKVPHGCVGRRLLYLDVGHSVERSEREEKGQPLQEYVNVPGPLVPG